MQFQSTLPARGATWWGVVCMTFDVFQSTLPARGATGSCIELFDAREISIHAPRTGSDKWTAFMSPPRGYFNPRSPHGERRHAVEVSNADKRHFNPRSPHGERHCIIACY